MSTFTLAATPFPVATLNAAGLNRQFIFDLADLPADLRESLEKIAGDLSRYRQLILIGHGGRLLWECVNTAGIRSANPIDDFSVKTIEQCFAAELPAMPYQFIYPGEQHIGLQQLGTLAGWHHASPFMVGIDEAWGSWSAYRAVLLADSHFAPSSKVDRKHPCHACSATPCISACPADALSGGRLQLDTCLNYRQQAGSHCESTCLARLACPVGSEHRYSDAQMQHVYGISLRWIKGEIRG